MGLHNQCRGRRVSALPAGTWQSNFTFSLPFFVIPFHHCRSGQAWDYDPRVGLIVAGGRTLTTQSTHSINMNISRDYGKSIDILTDLPAKFSNMYNQGIYGGCVVIINETTIFYAGGRCGTHVWGFLNRLMYRATRHLESYLLLTAKQKLRFNIDSMY